MLGERAERGDQDAAGGVAVNGTPSEAAHIGPLCQGDFASDDVPEAASSGRGDSADRVEGLGDCSCGTLIARRRVRDTPEIDDGAGHVGGMQGIEAGAAKESAEVVGGLPHFLCDGLVAGQALDDVLGAVGMAGAAEFVAVLFVIDAGDAAMPQPFARGSHGSVKQSVLRGGEQKAAAG